NRVRFFNGSGPNPMIPTDSMISKAIRYVDFQYARAERVHYVLNGNPATVDGHIGLNPGGWYLNVLGGNIGLGSCCGKWVGDVSEILLWDRILDPAEQQEVGAYLGLKYGLAHTWPVAENIDIAHLDPPLRTPTGVRLHAAIDARGGVLDALLYYGLADGGTNPAAWSHSLELGSVIDRQTNLAVNLSGLALDTTYYYIFRGTNLCHDQWAAQPGSWIFPSDSDRDGSPDHEEIIANTDPLDPHSFLWVAIDLTTTHRVQRLTFPTSTGRLYRIEYRTDLLSNHWNLLRTNLPGHGGPYSIPVTNSESRHYFRIGVRRP
ncbi:MAG: thrombospondin type 3 repeat-containing protein, partial [Verrucomicrobiota bacterium]